MTELEVAARGRGGSSRWSAVLAVWMLVVPLAAATAEAQVHRKGDLAFEYADAGDWVELATVADTWPEDLPGGRDAHWRNWLLMVQADFRGVAPPRHYYDHAVEATTEALVGSAAKFQIHFNPVFQRLTIHRVEVRRAGRWEDRFDPDQVTLARREGRFESDMATGLVSALIVVSDVRPGDVVRYAYSVEGENPILGGLTHFETPVQWIDPILSRQIVVDFPIGTSPAVRVLGVAPPASVERRSDRVRVVWQAGGVEAFRPESDTPSWHPVPAALQVAVDRGWGDISAWAAELYPGTPALPPDLESRIAEWESLPTPEARVAAALQAVQEEVRYFSVALGESSHRPALPEITWSRRYGDCKDKAWLLSMLLRRMGVDAVPALVNTEARQRLLDGVASASQFDHVIVRARVGGRSYWLDPTMTHQRGPLEVRQSANFGVALPVSADATALEPMTEAALVAGVQTVSERLTIADDGASALLEVVTRLAGPPAVSRRAEVQSQGIAALGQAFADYYHRVRGELEVLKPLAMEDDAETGELVLHESYRLAEPWFAKGVGERTLELHADQVAPLMRVEGGRERVTPLWLAHPYRASQTLEVVLPDGWRILDAANEGRFEDEHFRNRYVSKVEGGKFVFVNEYESKTGEVPAAQVAGHLETRRRAVAGTGVRIRAALPVDASRSDRAQRLRALLQEAANGR